MVAPAEMIVHRPAKDKRVIRASRARRAVQLDFFAPPRPAAPITPQKLTQLAMFVWRASGPVSSTLGEKFFTSRGLAVRGPDVVRFHPSLKFGDVRAPGLVWKLVDQGTSEPCGVMRVYLAADGSTVIGKRVLGRSVGASINREPRPP